MSRDLRDYLVISGGFVPAVPAVQDTGRSAAMPPSPRGITAVTLSLNLVPLPPQATPIPQSSISPSRPSPPRSITTLPPPTTTILKPQEIPIVALLPDRVDDYAAFRSFFSSTTQYFRVPTCETELNRIKEVARQGCR
jgi:hypothetical protein